jgi:tetratricopeptide (TPR) repeat protein
MKTIRFACAIVFLFPAAAFADDFKCGLEALKMNDYNLAISCFSAYLRANPRSVGALTNRGHAYAACKDFDKALADYSRAIHITPKDPELYYNRGTIYSDKQEYAQALEDYSRAIRLDPTFSLAFLNRGIAYNKVKQYEKAQADCSEAVRLSPNNVLALNNLAWLLATCPKAEVRDGKKALELAKKVCAFTGWQHPNRLATLAAAHAECGQFQDAVKWQMKALELGYEGKEATEKAHKLLKLYECGKAYREG